MNLGDLDSGIKLLKRYSNVEFFPLDIYTICFFTATSHEVANLLDLSQWQFYAPSGIQVMELLKKANAHLRNEPQFYSLV